MSSKYKRSVGRSIEEVMVRRKFDSTDPGTWPDPMKKIGSKQLNNLPNLQGTLLATKDNSADYNAALVDYSDQDKNKIMNSLMNYCSSLQKRVQELEAENAAGGRNNKSQLAMSRSLNMPAVDFDLMSTGSGGSSNAHYNQQGMSGFRTAEFSASRSNLQSATYKNAVQSNQVLSESLTRTSSRGGGVSSRGVTAVGRIITDIDEKVWNLKELFRKGDPLEQRRVCANKLVAVVRGYLVRCRKHAHNKALLEWKWIRCRQVVHLLDILLAHHSNRNDGIHLLLMNRNMKTMTNVYSKWAQLYRTNAPMRKTVRLAAESKIHEKKMHWLRAVFVEFAKATIGVASTKHANLERRKLVDTLRKNITASLLERGMLGVVPEMELEDALHKEVVLQFQSRKKILNMTWLFRCFATLHRMAKKNMAKAKAREFKTLAGKCFYAWSNYAFLAYAGLERKQWLGPRKYELRYNQKRIDHFAGFRCTRMIFKAWKAYFWKNFRVKKMHRHHVARWQQNVFKAWAQQSQHQHRLRLLTYENWKGYSRLIVYNPFYAWANYVKALKNHSNEQLRIAKSYLRWKWRQKLLHMMKAWRHLALFGRMDGLYTRQMLLKTLGEQKIFTNQLERLMIDQTTELDECRTLVRKEIEKRKALEAKLGDSTHLASELRMVNHHYQQEMMKMDATINAAIEINPRQLEHLRELHPTFKFKDRPLPIPKHFVELVGTSSSGSAAATGEIDKASKVEGGGRGAAAVAGEVLQGDGDNGMQDDDSHVAGGEEEDTINELPVGGTSHAAGNRGNVQVVGVAIPPPIRIDSSGAREHGGGDKSQFTPKTVATSDESVTSVASSPDPVGHGFLSKMLGGHDAAVNWGSPDFGAGGGGTGHGGMTSLNPADKLLLTRVKWLVERYRDTQRTVKQSKHKLTTMNLLRGAGGYSAQSHPPAPLGGHTEEEAEAYYAMLDATEIEAAAINVGDLSSVWLDQRPALLPVGDGGGGRDHHHGSEDHVAVVPFSGSGTASLVVKGAFAAGSTALPNMSRTAPAGLMMTSAATTATVTTHAAATAAAAATTDYNEAEFPSQSQYGLSDRMLLSFIDFLDTGDTTYFAPEERRMWTVYLMGLSQTRASLLPQSRLAQTAVDVATAMEKMDRRDEAADGVNAAAGTPKAAGAGHGELDTTSTPTSALTSAVKSPKERERSSSSPNRLLVIEPDVCQGSQSWRSALMTLRSEYPVFPHTLSARPTSSDGGPPAPHVTPAVSVSSASAFASGVTLDSPNEVAMFRRVLAMRENLDAVMERQISKYQRRLQEKMSMAALVEQEEGDDRGDAAGGGANEEESDDEDFGPPKAKNSSSKSSNLKKKTTTTTLPSQPKRIESLGSNIYASNLRNMAKQDDAATAKGGSSTGGGVARTNGSVAAAYDADKEARGGNALAATASARVDANGGGNMDVGPPLVKSQSRLQQETVDKVLATDDMYADLDED